MSKLRALLRLAALSLGVAAATPIAAPAQTRVTNTATLHFDGPTGPISLPSNTVAFDVEARVKRPTTLSFRLLPVGYELGELKCETDPILRFTPADVDAVMLASSPKLAAIDPTGPMIIVLENQGGNRDPNVREISTIDVEGAVKLKVPLTETGPDTGVFAGGVPGDSDGTTSPCDPTLDRDTRLTVSFAEDDFSYASTASVLIDPAGYVFDSQTGALVDGAIVELLDANGRPAQVFGDDGVSAYPSTVTSGDGVRDASGRVYDFSQGNYRFPLVAPGTYHIRVTPPANYVAPSQRSMAELAALRDPRGRPYILNDASRGGDFELTGSDPFFTDIPIDRMGETKLLLTKTASVREASPGDFIQYVVKVENRSSVIVTGLHLNDILPIGLRFQRGSTRGAAEPVISTDGRTLDFSVPAIDAGRTAEVRYVASVAPGAPQGEAVNRVLAQGSIGATSNEAAASVRLRPLLFTDGFTLIGRVTEGGCRDPEDKRKGIPGIRLMLEDGAFVVTDKDGLYHFEGVRPGRHVVQLDNATIPATHDAMLCDADTRQAGSALSRFVESAGGLLHRVDFQLRPNGNAPAAVDAVLPTASAAAQAAGDRDWFAGQAPGVELLFPEVDHNPRAPVLRVVIKHLPAQRVALRLNGASVDPLAFDATDTQGEVAISRWTGIPLVEGDNKLEARVLNADGSVAHTLSRTVHAAGAPVAASFVSQASKLIADGLTRPVLTLRLTDRAGRPVRDGTTVPVAIASPYSAAIDADVDAARGLNTRPHAVARVIGDEGLAYIALQPTTQAGALQAVVKLTDGTVARDVTIGGWLNAMVKDWTVVGFGSGTIGYDVLKTRASGLPRGPRREVVTDGQLAFYAKGRIKGSWLLTIAYDSDRAYDRSRGVLGTIDPDRYYTVYGDGTVQGYDAATSRKLYLRLERREFYALFGDFESGLTQTYLTRYSRTLNGVKGEYSGNRVMFSGFAAHSDEVFARDELRGNGLTGPYRLSGRDIVPNSDKLRIEVRDRLRPELIVSSTTLTRHIDYDIDPSIGTIRFREPVLGRDSANNPVFIVVDYETYGRGKKMTAAGRAAVKLAGGKVELGASAIRDEAQTATVAGLDLRASLSDRTELRAEAAAGGRDGIERGRAFIAEVEHHSAKVDGTVYARQQDEAFGISQQNIVEAGTRKLGVDGRVKLDEKLSLAGAFWYQAQLDGPGQRTAGEARLELQRASGTVFAGVQFAMDRGIDGEDRDSRLLTLGGSHALLGGKLTLTGQTQFAPGGERASVDFPARHQLLAAYRLSPTLRLLGGYEIAQGTDYTARTAQVGVDVAPWSGAKATSTLNQQRSGENGGRVYAQYGLNQSIPLSSRWTIDATLDATTTVGGRVPEGGAVQPFQTSGLTGIGGSNNSSIGRYGEDGDYTAITLGAGYRADKWSWNGRVEWRRSDRSDRLGLTSNVVRMLGEGKTLAAGLRYYTIAERAGSKAHSLTGDVALAWRPLDSRWSILERMTLRDERADSGITDRNVLGVAAGLGNGQGTLRAINNISINYRTGAEGVGHGFEATVYHGAKWVRGSYGADDYAGFIHVAGVELRNDLGSHFDIGMQASAQHAWSGQAVAFSGGPSIGVSPGRNMWISVGYNIAGYRDRDFEDDRYTRSGVYVTMRMKFDRGSIGNLLGAR